LNIFNRFVLEAGWATNKLTLLALTVLLDWSKTWRGLHRLAVRQSERCKNYKTGEQ
jgi:hypothetical protein